MIRLRRLLAALTVLAACTASEAGPAPARKAEHVLLISADGLAASYLDDPDTPMPTLRRLAAQGARAKGMLCSFPSVTWPNHTTLVTGVSPRRHGVIGNSYFDRTAGRKIDFLPDPLFDKEELVKAPTIYDQAHAAGFKTAGVIWPATRNARTLTWAVPDCGTRELWEKYATPGWLDELRREGIPVDMQEPWCKGNGGPQRDWMYARIVAHLLRRHAPNLLLLHLVETDHVQHARGPRTPDASWACSYADDRLRDVVEAVETAGLSGKTAIFLVSDHGFFEYRKTILPNLLLRREGLVRLGPSGAVESREAWCLPQGGAAYVYVLDPNRRADLVPRLKGLFRELEGIQAILDEPEFPALGLPNLKEDPRMPDLILAAREGYSFGDSAAGDSPIVEGALRGTHGALPEDPRMHATFVAWGAGIRRGVALGIIRNVDVAPTAARLLGLRLEGAEGRVLEEILER